MTILFETDRLIVRSWDLDRDTEPAFELYGDPQAMRFIGTHGQPEPTIAACRTRLQRTLDRYAGLQNGSGFWALVEKATGQLVGATMLKPLPDHEGNLTQDYEVGWHLRRASWGRGYATEAGRAALHYGFTVLAQPIVYAVVHPDNQASIRVTQRLGMTPLGRTNRYYGLELELFKHLPPSSSCA